MSTNIEGLQAFPQDTGVEVPIPLVEEISDKLLPEAETPRAEGFPPSTNSSFNRPTPLPIDLPTRSDIVVDIETGSPNSPDAAPRNQYDLERGPRPPPKERVITNNDMSPGSSGIRDQFSPRISGEHAGLLKSISIEPPTPQSPIPPPKMSRVIKTAPRSVSPAKDLLNDDPPSAMPLPVSALIGSKKRASPSPSGKTTPLSVDTSAVPSEVLTNGAEAALIDVPQPSAIPS